MKTINFSEVGKSSTKNSRLSQRIAKETEDFLANPANAVISDTRFTETDTSSIPIFTAIED